ncbi:glycoside hydrolase family 113 [Adhaeribacter aquaticus]|uniref:glycoside hydrolase family 113 n=1 Tax=Adhaeribacter aquaticus TaxID=299567 RepID=UPI001FE03128|nr:glycoside hydrolase TIM-barrel-like domain-containing protein [Adhaeribacter aquaticus]
MPKRFVVVVCLLGVGLLSSMLIRFVRENAEKEKALTTTFRNSLPKMKGVNWVAGDSITENQLTYLKTNNIEWIAQTPFGWQAAYNLPEIKMNTKASRAYWGESDRGIVYTTRLAKKFGIKTLLKPHLWLRDRSGKWLGDIDMQNESQWQEWFKYYRTFILHYAKLAQAEEIEAFCIGTELHKTAVTHEADWRKLIKEIRQVYPGKLTYAANWYLEYEQIKFWDALDFIGIQAYFPLTKKHNPSLQELKKGWQNHLPAIEKIAKKYNKPIVFTEAGYKNTTDAAIEPWAWPKRGETNLENESAETQASCYEALFQSVWQKSWFSGMFIWKWYPKVRDNNRDHRDFTPQHKPAEKTLATWYGKD